MLPVIVVGAGLAGLNAARQLKSALVLEGSDRIGGRLKTDDVEGFRLDHGFQVYFTAYPHSASMLDHEKLKLRRFEPGTLIFDGKQMHRIQNPSSIGEYFEQATSSYLSVKDKLLVRQLTSDVQYMSLHETRVAPEEPTDNFLRRLGFSDAFLDNFARPFFGGIFLDRSLKVSKRQFLFVWKMLSEGQTVVPAHGMAAIPEQLSKGLDVRLNSPVKEVGKTHVVLKSGERIDGSAVILATDAENLSTLVGTPKRTWKASTCAYFSVPSPLVNESIFMLRGNIPGRVSHVVPCSVVAPELAPTGRHLVSVTLLENSPESDGQLSEIIKGELGAWFPKQKMKQWQLLKVYRIPHAQFEQPSGFMRQQTPSHLNGIIVAGETTLNSSIDGAMESGILAARLTGTI